MLSYISLKVYTNWYVMTFVKGKFAKITTNFYFVSWRHPERASEYQFPALATLIYVDWLPTGQWSAVSSGCLRAWITALLCQQSLIADSSNLEMTKALSGCLQLWIMCSCRMYAGIMPVYIGLSDYNNRGLLISRLWSTADRRHGLDICSTLLYMLQETWPVIIPHMKHASSRAMAVLATLCFFPFARTIL